MTLNLRAHDMGEKAVSAILVIVAVACLAVPVRHLTDASLWMDEIATVQIAAPHLSIAAAYRSEMITDVNPPLYYLLQHFWLKLFDDQAWGGRLLSAVLLMAAVLVGARLAWRTLHWPAR